MIKIPAGSLAAAALLAGCAAGASQGTTASSQAATPAGSVAQGAASQAASGSAASGLPAWAAGLGSGVTLDNPTSSPAAGTPQAVVSAFIKALVSAEPGGACAYAAPSSLEYCRGVAEVYAQQNVTFSFNSWQLGYTALSGTEALVGSVYTSFCVNAGSTCARDVTDPKAVFSSGKSFASLWSEATASTSSSAPPTFTPEPCTEVNGKWYVVLRKST
jgi:hypothetical protein